MRRLWASGSALLCLAVSALAACSTVPKSFTPDRPIAPEQFSHQIFEDLIRSHVADGVVDYPAIATDGRLETYLGQLNRIDPNGLPTRDARLAFWINAYNAFAMKGILDGYSPKTLYGRYRYFIARDYEVGGQEINLYNLERKLLIPDFREPRIHFAIVCASRSCPKLRSRVFEPDRLSEQLDEAAREFVNDSSRNSFDRERKVARLSMIFKWFRSDFEAAAGSLPAYVSRYVTDEALGRDLASGAYTITFLDYDWNLNGRPPASGKAQAQAKVEADQESVSMASP
jgi:hypothetical protein